MISEELFLKTTAASCNLYRRHDPRTHSHRLVRVLGQALACDSALLVTVDVAHREFELAAWPSDHFQRVDHAQVMRLHAEEHPFVARYAQSRSVRALRLSDLMPREQFMQTGLYRNLYRFLGIEYQLAILVATPGAQWRALVLNRRTHDFSDAEQLALEALWPHIMLSQRQQSLGARQREAGAIAAEAADGSGVIVISSGGVVKLCSEPARVWLAEYFDALFLMRGVTLPPGVLRWAQQRVERESAGRGLHPPRRYWRSAPRHACGSPA